MVFGEDGEERVLDEGIPHCDGSHERIVRLDVLLAMSFHLRNVLISLRTEASGKEGLTESCYHVSKFSILKDRRRLTRNNITRIQRIFVLNKTKAIHQFDLGDLARMGVEVRLDICLGSCGYDRLASRTR